MASVLYNCTRTQIIVIFLGRQASKARNEDDNKKCYSAFCTLFLLLLFCLARCSTYAFVCVLVIFVASIIKLFSSFGGKYTLSLVWFVSMRKDSVT